MPKSSKKPVKLRLPDLSQKAYVGGPDSILDVTIRELQDRDRRFRAFREMQDHSSVIGGALLAIKSAIKKTTWMVEPGDGSAEEKKRAERLDQMRNDMSMTWEDTIVEILSMVVYGFHVDELVFKICRGPDEKSDRYKSKYSDGAVAWRKFVTIPQETVDDWVWNEEGDVIGLIQTPTNDYKPRPISMERTLLFRTESNRNSPEGRSLLLSAYYPWNMAKRIAEFEAIGVERDLAGIPFVGLPPEYFDENAPAEEKAMMATMKKLVTGVRNNSQAGIIFPLAYDEDGKGHPMFEFKLVTSGGMRQFDTRSIIERWERRAAMALLSDFILIGHERSSGNAVSDDKASLIGKAMNAILGDIAAVINMKAVPLTYRMNGWDTKAMSKFVPGDVEETDLKNLGVYLRNLAVSGVITPDPGLEAAVRAKARLPQIDPAYQLGPGETLGGGAAGNGDPNEEDAGGQPKKPTPKKPKKGLFEERFGKKAA